MRLKPLIPTNLVAGALVIAGLSLIAFSLAPSGQDAALAGRDHQDDHDCNRNQTYFDGKEDKCMHHTKTPTATPETPTSTPETPTATTTPEDPTATPESPTTTPETPTSTPETPTSTPTETTAVSGVAPTSTPELVVEILDTTATPETAVLAAAPTEEVAVLSLPASDSGGSTTSGIGFKLGIGIGAILLGALIGLYGMRLDSHKQKQ